MSDEIYGCPEKHDWTAVIQMHCKASESCEGIAFRFKKVYSDSGNYKRKLDW